MSKIIVAVDESPGSSDAIALASTLAGITGSTLTFANVFPYDPAPSRASNHAFEEYLRQDSRELLERVRDAHADESVELRSIANPSASHGLHELAEHEDADLIVVGSTHTGRAGRVLPGSTAERLLHGAPCPVAVAPKGYAQRSDESPTVIGCGYDGTPSARRALHAAARLAAGTGARLLAIRVFEPLLYDLPPGNAALGGMSSYNDSLHARASEELEAAVAAIESDGAESRLEVGNAANTLVDASGDLDLLVVGSRGYGPMHAVMVGGVSGRLVREAACPVIVFPRSAGQSEDDSLFAKTAALHG
jgi:nucleotide-binding universal stress UspA family protein